MAAHMGFLRARHSYPSKNSSQPSAQDIDYFLHITGNLEEMCNIFSELYFLRFGCPECFQALAGESIFRIAFKCDIRLLSCA